MSTAAATTAPVKVCNQVFTVFVFLQLILLKYILGVGCVIRKKRLDFGADPDHDAEFYHCEIETVVRFL